MKDVRSMVMNKTAGGAGLGKGAMMGSGKKGKLGNGAMCGGGMAGDSFMGKGSSGSMANTPKIKH